MPVIFSYCGSKETLLNRDTFRETALVRQVSNELREQGLMILPGSRLKPTFSSAVNPMVQEAEWRQGFETLPTSSPHSKHT